MLKKPLIAVNCVPVAVYNINQRIELEQCNDIIVVYHCNIPQNRRYPHSHLKSDIDNLCQVPEKHHHRTGAIAHGKHQNKQAKAVINHL